MNEPLLSPPDGDVLNAVSVPPLQIVCNDVISELVIGGYTAITFEVALAHEPLLTILLYHVVVTTIGGV